MKYSLAIAALAVAASAQLNTLPECGQLCVNNMIQVANTNFGCANGDALCYCRNEGFGLGLRDCSGQACGAAVQSQVVAYGNSYCSSAAAAGGASSTATSLLSSASSAAASAASSASSVASSAAAAASSVGASATSAAASGLSSVASGASSVASRASSAASGAAGAATSTGAGAMRTAAPMAGALAAAAMFVL